MLAIVGMKRTVAKKTMDVIEDIMQFTLITTNGKIMQFYVEGVANLYRNLYGGVVFTNKVLDNVAECDTIEA